MGVSWECEVGGLDERLEDYWKSVFTYAYYVFCWICEFSIGFWGVGTFNGTDCLGLV